MNKIENLRIEVVKFDKPVNDVPDDNEDIKKLVALYNKDVKKIADRYPNQIAMDFFESGDRPGQVILAFEVIASNKSLVDGIVKEIKQVVKRKYPKMKVTLSMKGDTFKTY